MIRQTIQWGEGKGVVRIIQTDRYFIYPEGNSGNMCDIDQNIYVDSP